MSNFKQRLKNRLGNPRLFLEFLFRKLFGRWMSSKLYLSGLYRINFGHKMNWEHPQSFNEKLNWCKVYNRIDLYTTLADKYAVKQFVADRIGKEYVVENYGVWENWDEVDFSKLPDQFVLKCTHDSGGAFICRDKSTFDKENIGRLIKKNLKKNLYYGMREWPYKNIPPRIIADRLLDDHTGKELRDYKWWCFNGKPQFMYCTIKGENLYENFYDMDFHPVAINHGFPRHKPEFEKPNNFELMKDLAAKLADGIPFVRIDFFDVDGHVYFGEFTFFDWAGMQPFADNWDEILGELIKLPSKN